VCITSNNTEQINLMQLALRPVKLCFLKSMQNETQEVTFKVAPMGRCDLTYRS